MKDMSSNVINTKQEKHFAGGVPPESFRIKHVPGLFEDFLFPRHCPICDRVLKKGEEICPPCSRIPRTVKPPRCVRCSKHIVTPGNTFCFDCLRTAAEFDRGFSLYEYSSIHDSISTFKNLGRPDYGIYYGRQMGRVFKEELAAFSADALIPIPLHPSRQRSRGYNQAQILAEGIGEITGIPVITDCLKRPGKAFVQKYLGREDRRKNMKKAFHIAENDVKLETVILVDDIYTTGSTIGAAAAVLRNVGVEHVYFITLATGRGL